MDGWMDGWYRTWIGFGGNGMHLMGRKEKGKKREEGRVTALGRIPRIIGTNHDCAVYDTGCDSSVH